MPASSLRHPGSKRRGFTLVELLVVIGIIAILISVLLPTLANARRSATSVKCLSNLKNIHNVLLMYAADHKNATPVARQDYPEIAGVPQNLPASAGGLNFYWTDMLYPYLFKNAVPTANFTRAQADTYRSSVLWCPTWSAEHPEYDPGSSYNDRFKNGYAINIYLGFKPQYPNPDAMLPLNQLGIRSGAVFLGMSTAANVGKYYKRNEISDQAERMIVADSDLWVVGLGLTNNAGAILGQRVTPGLVHNGTPGAAPDMNYDRYRHGKRPGNDGTRFNTSGGLMKYNVLYADGHAGSLSSIKDGYKAIRMRYP